MVPQKWTDVLTDGRTDGRTFCLIESIGPEGRCFEKKEKGQALQIGVNQGPSHGLKKSTPLTVVCFIRQRPWHHFEMCRVYIFLLLKFMVNISDWGRSYITGVMHMLDTLPLCSVFEDTMHLTYCIANICNKLPINFNNIARYKLDIIATNTGWPVFKRLECLKTLAQLIRFVNTVCKLFPVAPWWRKFFYPRSREI